MAGFISTSPAVFSTSSLQLLGLWSRVSRGLSVWCPGHKRQHPGHVCIGFGGLFSSLWTYCPASLQTSDFRLDVIHREAPLVRWYFYIVTNTTELCFAVYPQVA